MWRERERERERESIECMGNTYNHTYPRSPAAACFSTHTSQSTTDELDEEIDIAK